MIKEQGRLSHRDLCKNVDVDVYIDFDDVMEYIEDYATSEELKQMASVIFTEPGIEENSLEGSYIMKEKTILLSRAAKKYTLEELEQRLGGNKFDLI